MALVPISAGYAVLIDADDVERVAAHKWTAQPSRDTVYAYRQPKIDGRKQKVYLHRFILGLPPGRYPEVDHLNGDGLDNRKLNLRAATSGQNSANQRVRNQIRPKTSRFKGVSWHTPREKWVASITCAGKRRHLGLFVSEIDAARAYDKAAKDMFGEYAKLNT